MRASMFLAVIAAALSAALVGAIRTFAIRSDMMDHPSARSSHLRPVPRGGGAGVIGTILLLLLWHAQTTMVSDPRFMAALAGVGLVAVVGWLDDRRSLGAVPRLAVHVIGGGLVAWGVAGAPGPLGAVGVTAVVWWITWTVAMINVTNFMDGIDGLIGSQMVIFGWHLWWGSAAGDLFGAVGAVLAGACAGFLAWNWAPARIFLGDVGSGALGAVGALGGALAVGRGVGPVEIIFLPLLPLFLDGTVTLVRRLLRGERVWEAHRSHLYQRLANGGWGHARTAGLYALAALAGVLVSRVGTSSRTLAGIIYAAGVVAVGVWLETRAQSTAGRGTERAPSP
jgi:UDP-N-acetylmuramyl pentapeptide phosphotransferase/UDP-N-acetylglucosamine-1-phosphate transferase